MTNWDYDLELIIEGRPADFNEVDGDLWKNTIKDKLKGLSHVEK